LTNSIDNGHSFAGKYGLGNPIVTWLISRGMGELVALTPEEMQKPEAVPKCPSPTSQRIDHAKGEYYDVNEPCKAPMLYRAQGWVCYEHATPVRVRRQPRLQEMPEYQGRSWDAIGSEVDLVYTKEDHEKRPTWKYVERPL
jgi:hypothetical protein